MDTTEDKSLLLQTIARNLTDKELEQRLFIEGDKAPLEYRQEAARRFGGLDTNFYSPTKQYIKREVEDVLDSSESIRDAVEELHKELDEGRDFL